LDSVFRSENIYFTSQNYDVTFHHLKIYEATLPGKIMNKAYEIHNPDFSDMSLDEQIAAGCCDWCVEGRSGHEFFGRTAVEAVRIAKMYEVSA